MSYHRAFPPVSAALRLSSASFLEGVLTDVDGSLAYSLFTTRGVTTLCRVGPNLSRTQTAQIIWPREARDLERAKEAGETVVATSSGKMLMDDVLRPSGSGRSRKMNVPGSTTSLRWRFESGAWHCTTASRAVVATLKLVPGQPGTTLFIHTTSVPSSPAPSYSHGYDSDTSEASPNPHAAQALFDSLVLAAVLLCTHPDAWRARLAGLSSERPLPCPPVRSTSAQQSAYERTIGKSISSRSSSSSSSHSC